MKYKCKCKTFEVNKNTVKVLDGEIVVLEAYCSECKTYGEYIKEHKGFANIIKKPNGTVGGKF